MRATIRISRKMTPEKIPDLLNEIEKKVREEFSETSEYVTIDLKNETEAIFDMIVERIENFGIVIKEVECLKFRARPKI